MNDKRLTKLSDIAGNIGLVFFASVFIGPIISGGQTMMTIISGLILSIACWYISMVIIK